MLGAGSQSYRQWTSFANDPGAVVAQLFFAIVDAFALTVLVFFRRGFGERFYTPFKYLMGIGIISFLVALRSLGGLLMGLLPFALGMGGMSPLLGMLAGPMLMPAHAPPKALFDATNFLYWAFVIVGGAQLIAVWMRSWRIGDAAPVYSRSTGEPLLTCGGKLNYWFVTIILEPFAVLVLGQILTACDPRVPYTFFVVLALFIQGSSLNQFRLYRSDLLDQQDAQLLATFYSGQMKRVAAGEKPLAKLAGIFMPLMLPRKPAMQVNALRQWAMRHQEEAGVASTTLTLVPKEEDPPPPPPQKAA